ncbi:MAG: DUF2007 domain-containing protein [Rikenellaceae bacterium]
MNSDRMVLLAEYDSISQAEMAKSALDSAGIWAMINNEYMSAIYPTGIMPAQVIVIENDLARAKAVVSSFASLEEE